MKVGNNANGSSPTYTVTDITEDEVISFESSSNARAKNNLGDIWVIGDQVLLGNQDADTASTPRSRFYTALNAAGFNFSFTGHLTGNSEGLSGANYTSHSCINNATIDTFRGNLGTFWNRGRLASAKPEVVCIMLGTNDINADNIANTPERFKALMDELYALPGIGNPTVLVGAIPPNQTYERKKTNVNIYNEALESIVRSYQLEGKDNILFVDHFNALGGETTATILRNMQADPNSEFGPSIHLNSTGNSTVGNLWHDQLCRFVTTYGIPEDPWAFPKNQCVRSLVKDNSEYYEYFFDLPGIGNFSVIPPKHGVVHKSGKKPWMWRNIFYSANTGKAITNDIPLIDEGFYAVNVYGSVTGHASGNSKVKGVYDYLTSNFGFAPTFSASAMSRGGFMVMRFATEYPDLIEGILMDNACADGLSWPLGRSNSGHLEYAPGKFYSGNGSNGSTELYLDHYTQYTTIEEVVQHLTYDSPVDQLGPLAESGVKILSICGSADHAVPIGANDLALQAEYERLGGDFTLVIENKGHKHGQATTAGKNAFLNFVRDNAFRVPNNIPSSTRYNVVFELGEGSRSGGGALSQSVLVGGTASAPKVTPPAGYTFSGWSSSLDNMLSDCVIAAVYRRNANTPYTVTFDISTGTRTGGGALTQSVLLDRAATAPNFTPPSGYTFKGWNSQFNKISADRTITALFTKNNNNTGDHSVVFNLNGGTRTGGGALTQTVAKGMAATWPTINPPSGYIFAGWSTSPEVITSDVIITALYKVASGESYTVTFDLAGGTRSGGGRLSQTIAEGGSATAPTVTPPTGYTFTGWSRSFTNVSSNLTVTAQYAEVSTTTYTVTFNIGSGTRSGGGALSQTVAAGGSANAPTVTPPTGYIFNGWDRTFTNVTSNLTVNAQYSSTNTGGGTGSGTTISNGTGRYVRVEIPSGTATTRLYMTEVEVFVGGTNVAPNGTATQISDLTESYPASKAIDNGASTLSESRTTTIANPWWEVDLGSVKDIEKIVIYNVAESSKFYSRLTDFTVSILDANRNVVHSATGLPTAAVTTLTKGGAPPTTYSVTFDVGAGSRSGGGALRQTIESGSAATAPTVTPPAGFTFTGWNRAFTNVTSNLTVTARYEAVVTNYTVTFNLGAGSRSGGGALSQTVASGSAATAPTVTPPSGYTFSGWSRTFTNVTSNLTVNAQYTETNTGGGSGSGTTITNGTGRYVRVQIPANTRLYMTEVEVFVGGVNIAPNGTASQVSDLTESYTANKAIDRGASTLSESRTATVENPWWELDLGSVKDIEQIKIYNVAESNKFFARFTNFTVSILDAKKNVVHSSTGLPAASVTTLSAEGTEGNEFINGIPRSWLTANGYALNVAATNSDNDGDGHTALQEYLAGTNPNQKSSRFKMRSCKKENNSVTLDWNSVIGKTYNIWYSPDMSSGSWSVIQSGISGAADATSYVINVRNSSELKGFYRVEVGQ